MKWYAPAVLLITGLVWSTSSFAQGPEQGFPVRVRILTSERRTEGSSYVLRFAGYVDGTPAQLRCPAECSQLRPGMYFGRWDKDKLKIRSVETFGKHKVLEDKFEVSLGGPKRDLSWGRDKPVLITAYGMSEQECLLPIRLAQNVIGRIDHPTDWRVVITCTPQAWEAASLQFHAIGGTRVAFTIFDDPRVPPPGVVLTVLNVEQFDHCMRPGCYVHTILHELGHYRKVSGIETVADADAVEHEQALYREHKPAEFPSIQDLKKCAATPDCQATSPEIRQLAAAYQAGGAQTAATPPPAAPGNGAKADATAADTDPTHYPLRITLLEVEWRPNAGGGAAGTGRGDISNGASITAFDFNGVCASGLNVSARDTLYLARWNLEPSKLLVVSSNPQTKVTQECELNTVTHPESVYLRNTATGTVTTFTQEQFKAMAEQARARAGQTAAAAPKAALPKLTNADVMAMVMADLSVAVIQAKIEASDCVFDTSPEGLRQLKAAKVPDAIVLEMIKRATR